MPTFKSEPPRGILNQREGKKLFKITRYHPSAAIAYFVEHYWIVRWELKNTNSFQQDVLSHPSVHLVFAKNNTKIWGIVTKKFTRLLEGKGQVLGIKFRPGGFYPFLQKPVASFTNDVLPFNDVFDDDLTSLEEKVVGSNNDEAMVKQAEAFLASNLPERDPKVEEICHIAECIMEDKSILRVDDIVNHFEINKRSLQRLFRRYVGASPKWMIQRYRLHEAAEQIANSKVENWPDLALELGYFDQAHFINDFKSIVGQSPAEYAKAIHHE